MITISVHGRSGQGIETTLKVIASALSASGMSVQTLYFPPQERRGCHAYGLVKADKAQLMSRQLEPEDVVLIFDTTLDMKQVLGSARERGVVIFNSRGSEKFSDVKKKHLKSYALDATGISMAISAKPVPNMPMLGALAKSLNKISLKSLRTLAESVSKDAPLAVEEGYKAVKQVKL